MDPRPSSLGGLRRSLSSARRRLLLHRRLLAALAVAVAVLAGLQAAAGPGAATTEVTVAARDLPAGTTLAAADLTTVAVPLDAAPARSPAPDELLGRVLAGPVPAAETVTEARLVGAAGLDLAPGQVAVPVRLPDPGTAALLRLGDEVDLVATDPQAGSTRTVGRDVRVVALPEPGDASEPGATTGRLVVVAVASGEAHDVAGAAVRDFLTVAFRP